VTAACSGGDDDRPDETAPATAPIPIDQQLPDLVTEAAADPDFVDRILADDTVTADELAGAYDAYIGCLAEGGGSGRYSYDVELRAPLALDWGVPGDGPNGTAAAALDAGCSSAYLDDLVAQFDAGNPAPDELTARQRERIVTCVAAVDPGVAAEIPDAITTDTLDEGLYIGDPQLGAEFLGADADQTEAIGLCFTTIGGEWHEFGTPPPATSAPGATSPGSTEASSATT
jgi:hypothetical protein